MFQPIGRKKGFTLLELLIVLSILAILAGIVILMLTTFIGRGKTEACNADQRQLQSAVAAYYHANDSIWPTDGGGSPGDLFFGNPLTSPLVGGYIDRVPGSDANCDWQIDANGWVVPDDEAEDCPCD